MAQLNDKLSHLPIEKKEFGFVQKNSYHQPDLYHEEVLDLDSPFADVVPVNTQVFTFLLLGDQNAGKSTYLHSFSYQNDINFLPITSIIPILSSSFINTRFYFGDAPNSNIPEKMKKFEPMDELPFLDTDIARGSFLVTREVFEFFLMEYTIPRPAELRTDTVYVVIQFIEIGGDHMDTLMEYRETKPQQQAVEATADPIHRSLVDILERSYDLLLKSKKTIYFINAATLFSTCETGESILNGASFVKLITRLRFLNATFPEGHQMLFYLSRYLQTAIFTVDSVVQSLGVIRKECGIDIMRMITTPLSTSVTEFIMIVLEAFAHAENWSLKIVNVWPASHIKEKSGHSDDTFEEGSLNPEEIISTLVRCFMSQMVQAYLHHCWLTNVLQVHSDKPPYAAVAEEIVKCYKSELEEFREKTKQHSYGPIYWIDKEDFRECLAEEDFVEAPHPVLLQGFERVSVRMVDLGLCLWHNTHNHANLIAVLKTNKGVSFDS